MGLLRTPIKSAQRVASFEGTRTLNDFRSVTASLPPLLKPDPGTRWGEDILLTLRPDMLLVIPKAPFAFKDSMIHKFCNSHYVSQLAAFFIDARAKRSTVISCLLVCFVLVEDTKECLRHQLGQGYDARAGLTGVDFINLKDLTRGRSEARSQSFFSPFDRRVSTIHTVGGYCFFLDMVMILPQVHLRKPCYDFYFL